MEKKEKYFILILFLISLLIKLSLAFLTPYKFWDETIYANLGKNIVLYQEYSYFHGFGDFYPDWPLAGGRPPLIPFTVALVYLFSKNIILLNIIGPIISSIGIIAMFILAKKLFNKEIAIYSSLILAFFPMTNYWGSKLLTDIPFLTFLIASSYFFLKTFLYEKKQKNSAILFALFLALAFFTRYTIIWFFPVIFIWLLYKYKGLGFIKNKNLWLSGTVFLIIVLPWFIFNYLEFNSLLGFLKNSADASVRWGGKSLLFYLNTLKTHFWFLMPLSIVGLFIYKKIKFKNQAKMFIIIWLFVSFIMASITPAKEDRYLLIILPPLILLSSWTLSYIKERKKLYYLIISLLIIILFTSNITLLNNAYIKYKYNQHDCFFKSMDYIKHSGASYVVTEHFSPVYFYTNVQNIRVDNYTITKEFIEENHPNKYILYYYSKGDWFDLENEEPSLKGIYECEEHKVLNLSISLLKSQTSF